MKPNRRRVLVRMAIAVPGIYVVYLVVMNLLFVTGLFKSILNHIDAEHVHFDYSSAYTVWFGEVRTKNFVVVASDSAVQWRVAFDEGKSDIALSDLLSKRVHLNDSWARGVSVRVRFKMDPSDATPDFVAKLPPIDGFADPPLKPVPLPAAPTDENYSLWTVQVDDAEGEDIREVWVDALHMTDSGGRVVGSIFYKPLRWIRLDPSVYQANACAVLVGKDTVVSSVHGSAELQLAGFDPRVPKGSEAFRFLTGRAKLLGKLETLAPMSPLLPLHATVTGANGAIDLDVSVIDGVMQPGGRIDVRADGWALSADRDAVSGSSIVFANTSRLGILVSTHSSDVELTRNQKVVAHAPTMSATFMTPDRDLVGEWKEWSGSSDIDDATFPDLRSVNEYLKEPMIYGGSGHATIHANVDARGASGSTKVALDDAQVLVGKSVVRGDATASVTLQRWEYTSKQADLEGAHLELHNLGIEKRGTWWASASASPFVVSTSGPPSVSAHVTGTCRNIIFPLQMARAPAFVSALSPDHVLGADARLHTTTDVVDVEALHVTAPGWDALAHYRSTPSKKFGVALINTPLTSVGLTVDDGHVAVRPFATNSWYATTVSPLGTALRD